MRWLRSAALIVLLGIPASAQTIVLETLVSGLTQPVYLAHAGDGSNRRFILEQPGRILVMPTGSATTTVFLDIRSRVLSGGEQGLLGLAFHPQFSANRRFFVNYTRRPDGATVVAEYRVPVATPDAADPASETVLMVIAQPYSNHNGGMIEFGHDNYLYIGMGDGGSGNDPENRAQNTGNLLGKMLRIDVDRPDPATSTGRYSAPSGNPFLGANPGLDEIFAYGLRNPWRFSFDRLTGELYAGDVGQSAREEIDIVAAGGNYGWRVFEGTRCTNLGPAACAALSALPPLTEYINGQLGRCSVTGGYVYRGTRRSLPYGAYVFADYCSGEIFLFRNGSQSMVLDTSLNIASFGEDEAGEIYVLALGGSIYRITSGGASTFSQRLFTLTPRTGLSLPSSNAGVDLTVGYARIDADAGGAPPDALAIFDLRQNGILISEASVPAAPAIADGRILAVVSESTNTGVAVANPGNQPVTVNFYFTRADGQDFGSGSFPLAAGRQIAAFLDQPPFSGGSSIDGTFTFSASGPVAAVALQGTINSRGEFLMTTLPVAALGPSVPAAGAAIPHWAHGGGWATEFALVNTSDQPITGTLELRDTAGQLWSTLPYSIPQRSSRRLAPPGSEPSTRTGSAQILPVSGAGPSAVAIFRMTSAAGVLSQAGVPAIAPGTAFRGYGEVSTAVRTGLAVANLSTNEAVVTVELTRLDGAGAIQTGTITVPAGGQVGRFLDEIPGLVSANPFQGIVRVLSGAAIAVTSLRGRTNERGEFLITASPPSDEGQSQPAGALFMPHFAVGGGYDTQFVLLHSQPAGGQTGTLSFFGQDSQPLGLAVP